MQRPAVRKKMGRVINHFSHNEHPLEFMSSRDAQLGKVQCSLCKSSSFTTENFYGCLRCRYFLDPLCATKLEEKAYLFCHEDHPVTLITSPPWSTVPCKACGGVIPGPRYNCRTCSYDFHPRCSTWPQNAKVEDHIHPHLLCRSFPRAEGRTFNCELCGQGDGGFWGYKCKECTEGFFMHLDCKAFRPSSGSNGRNLVGDEASNKDVAKKINSLEAQLQGNQVKDIISNAIVGVNAVLAVHRLHGEWKEHGDAINGAAEESVGDGADQMIEQVQEVASNMFDIVLNFFTSLFS